MNEPIQLSSLLDDSSARQRPSEPTEMDAFVLAKARLRAKRPLRNARLRQIAANLGARPSEVAERDLRNYLTRYPQDGEALWLLAQVIMRGGRLREAAPLLLRCLEAAPALVLARFNYAKLLFHFCHFPAAQNQLEYLLERDPKNPIFL